MQSGNQKIYIRKYKYVDSLSCYEKIKQAILNKLKENLKKKIKNDLSQEKCGFLTIW